MAAGLVSPDGEFREALARRGGAVASRCMQCATCSSVCDLTSPEAPFPRRQVLWAQWGMADRIEADPSIWLCHQCNDCTKRCPRDARPGDVLQSLRAVMVERLGAPRWLARLVGNARVAWPLLVGLPILFWALLVRAYGAPHGSLAEHGYGGSGAVPYALIYAVYFPAVAFAAVASSVGAWRAWRAWGGGTVMELMRGLLAVAGDIMLHRRFDKCAAAKPRRLGHLALLWGFAAAAAASGLIVIAHYGFGAGGEEMHFEQTSPLKILGNVAAVLLTVGVVRIVAARLSGDGLGAAQGYDSFFLWLVAGLTFTGIGAEIARYVLSPGVALAIYVTHLGIALCLFITFPYSKFAHALYRTLALAHERRTGRRSQS